MARRSLTGMGRICGIYTMGMEDPYAVERGQTDTASDFPIITASIGEDFADCKWPITVKAQASVTAEKLAWYLRRLLEATGEGFFMDPDIGSAIYWRWTGTVVPGISGPDETEPRRSMEQTAGTGDRSFPGHGPRCGIYLADEAENWAGDSFYGKIEGSTAISGSVDEDYAASRWPIVAKIHSGVTREKFCQYLTDLATCIEGGYYFEVTELLDQ